MAGQIAELAHRTLRRDFRRINTRTARVDPARRRAARCCRRSARKLGAEDQEGSCEKLGVEVLLGAMVTDVDERGIEVKYKDGRERADRAVTKMWAAGVQASPLGPHALRADRRRRWTAPAGSR